MAYHLAGTLMVGGILPWFKSFTNTPSLVAAFVECNGQTLSDAQSVYDGQVIPNLNGASAQAKRWLRGSTTSGSTGGAETHTHGRDGDGNMAFSACVSFCPKFLFDFQPNLSPYYESVYIFRVK